MSDKNDYYEGEDGELPTPTDKQLHEHDLQNEKHDSEDWDLY